MTVVSRAEADGNGNDRKDENEMDHRSSYTLKRINTERTVIWVTMHCSAGKPWVLTIHAPHNQTKDLDKELKLLNCPPNSPDPNQTRKCLIHVDSTLGDVLWCLAPGCWQQILWVLRVARRSLHWSDLLLLLVLYHLESLDRHQATWLCKSNLRPAGGTRWNMGISRKSVGFILWERQMSGQIS